MPAEEQRFCRENIENVQVLLCDVRKGSPCVEALIEEALGVLGKAEPVETMVEFAHASLCGAMFFYESKVICRSQGPASVGNYGSRQTVSN